MKKLALAAFLASVSVAAQAAPAPVFDLEIKDHTFHPATLEVPANTKVQLRVKNLDTTPEEFESHDLKREKVIKGGSEALINVGPLKAGEYKFFGEFHESIAQGVLVVKDAEQHHQH